MNNFFLCLNISRLKKDIFFLSCIGIALFLPFTYIISNIFTGIILLNWVIDLQYKVKLKSFIHNKFAILFTILYGIYIISLCYTSDFNEGLSQLEKTVSLFIFPLVFSTFPIKNKKYFLNFIFKAFILSCIVSSLICIVYAFSRNIAEYGTSYKIQWEYFTYHPFTSVLGLHSIYYAMYLVFAILILFENLFFNWKNISKKKKIRYVIIIFYLVFVMLLCTARMEILAFGVIFFGLIIYGAVKFKKPSLIIGYIVGFSLLIFTTIAVNPVLKERVKEAINYKSQYDVDEQWGGRALRLLKWDCSLDIINSNLIYGVGLGDAQHELNECYKRKSYTPLLYWPNVTYNAHNEFLQTAISTGVVGLLIFLSCLLKPLIASLKKNKKIYIIFLVLFSLCCLTESMLYTNKGIVFYSFFNSLLAFYYLNSESTDNKLKFFIK